MRPRPILPVTTADTRPPRAPVPVRGIRAQIVSINDVWSFSGWIRTLGTGGMRVEVESRIPVDTEVRIDFMGRLGEQVQKFSFLGWVVYHDQGGVALQFDRATVTHPEWIAHMVAHYLDKATQPA